MRWGIPDDILPAGMGEQPSKTINNAMSKTRIIFNI